MTESAERTPAPPRPAASAGQPGSAHVHGTRRQRRPTGAPPPLPHPIAVSTTAWLLLAVLIVAFAFVFSEITPWRRAALVNHVQDTEGLALCGRDAACPG